MNRRSALAVSQWNPLTPANPLLWLDAMAFGTLTLVSGGVSVWSSRNPGGFSVQQGTALLRPVYGTTLYNGVNPGIHFTGATQYTDLRFDFARQTGSNWPFTIIARFKMNTRGVQQRVAAYNYVAGGSSINFDADTLNRESVDFASGGAPQEGPNIITGSYLTWGITGDSTMSTYVNGVLSLANGGGSGTFNIDEIAIGGNALLGTLGAEMILGEIIFYSVRLTSSDMAAAHRYLAAKWGG